MEIAKSASLNEEKPKYIKHKTVQICRSQSHLEQKSVQDKNQPKENYTNDYDSDDFTYSNPTKSNEYDEFY